MNSVLALAIAAISASVATYLLAKPKSGGGGPDMSVFTGLLKEIDDKLRDGRIDQATADAERQRILQIIVSVSTASAPASSSSSNPLGELIKNPSAMAAAAVALVAVFVFVASENEASSLVAGAQQTPAVTAQADSSKDAAVSQLQAYARSVQGDASAAAPAPAPAPARMPVPAVADAGKPADAPASSPMSKRPMMAPPLPMEGGGPGKQPLADVDTMMGRLEARLEKDPNNPEGWRMLGWSYFSMKNYTKAVEAYARAVALKPDSTAFKAAHAEAVVKAANDVVTPEAAAEFDAVLAAEPGNVRAVYFKGLAKEQSGDKKGALEYWTASLKAAPPDVEWASDVKERIEKLGRETGAAAPAQEPAKTAEPAKTEEAPKQADASRQVEAPKETAKEEPKAADAPKAAEAPKEASKAEEAPKQAEAPKEAAPPAGGQPAVAPEPAPGK